MPRSKKSEPAPKTEAEPKAKSKLETLTELLCRPDGATLEQMQAATGWQSHSVRGALAGALKRKLGGSITSASVDGKRVYRVNAQATA